METINSTAQIIEDSVKNILSIYDDETREGLFDTPKRVTRMYAELLTPIEFNFTAFDANGYDEMIIEKDIPFYSLCEHHLVPFFGTASVGYIPDKKIVGISKLSRTVEYYARRLQVQERMTQQIATYIQEKLSPLGIGVIIKARHLCQEMRGIKKQGSETITSCMKGVMLDKFETREEFIQLCK